MDTSTFLLLLVAVPPFLFSIVIFIFWKRNRSLERECPVEKTTGLLTSHFFLSELVRLAQLLPVTDERRKSTVNCITLCLIDLCPPNRSEYVVPINKIIRKVAIALQKQVREGDVIGRWNETSIAIIFLNMQMNDSRKKAHELRRVIGRMTFGSKKARVAISIGTGTAVEYVDPGDLISLAKEAAFVARAEGDTSVVTF